MTKFRTLHIFLMVFALFALNSCDEDEGNINLAESEINSVNDVIAANGNLSSLGAALKAASGDLPTTLQGAGPFTIFAPKNSAFTALAKELGYANSTALLDNIDPTLLSTILTYHVVAGEADADSLTDGQALSTVMGDELTVSIDEDGNIQILDATDLPQTETGAAVSFSNSSAPNGIVHFIDKILLPQGVIETLSIEVRPTILEWATSTEDLTILVSALKKTDLVGTVTGLDSATVLAPNNAAFADLLESLGDDYNSLDDFDNATEIALLGDILKYHVLPSSELMAGQADTALEENSVEVIAENGGFAFGDATAVNAGTVTADIAAKNGFVQIIDKVLLPQSVLDFLALLQTEDLASIVTREPGLSTLEEALAATDLVTTFADITNESFVQGEDEEDDDFAQRSTPENFTYFKPATVLAPTNAAFQVLLDAMGADYTSIASFDTDAEKALLKEILLYHVIEGKVASADLAAGDITTVAGSDISIISVVGTDTFVIGDATNNVNANIASADALARNGVAHVIDKVLLPESAVAFINSLNEDDGIN
ncbi:Uncaracterized surface protein containing fasciclin (FAS1) repeats [Pricia antarctica]|uniref:Uncaracterized surface protein containing fasciclin (FAS1) repeats n=1 Tax=Pricia antarctica TaxID=641691 RepID=A0A1G6X892_9FLAO|nr:fasciclin domain-containing protein [Pricia antarctica]SDD74348.1 Uncaracterized surface protein containing fasciclin (FAS1) repeats [Pricia antarctica]